MGNKKTNIKSFPVLSLFPVPCSVLHPNLLSSPLTVATVLRVFSARNQVVQEERIMVSSWSFLSVIPFLSSSANPVGDNMKSRSQLTRRRQAH